MFQAAASNHFNWNCQVGGGSQTSGGKLYGIGCTLDETHVLTCHHVWAQNAHKHEMPTVLRRDGGFPCEIVFESAAHDIMVLRATSRMENGPNAKIEHYPSLSAKPLWLGSFVGFLSKLRLIGATGEREPYQHFAFGAVSIAMPESDGKASQFALSSTVAQSGFSGSPVFRPDGSIVGILTGGVSFIADAEADAPRHNLPLISPIFPVAEQLAQAGLRNWSGI